MANQPETVFTVYGLVLTSPYPFQTPLYPSAARPDFFFDFRDEPLWSDREWQGAVSLTRAFDPNRDYVEIRRSAADYLFWLVDLARFRISPGTILGHAERADELIFAEKELFDTVLPMYLELNGWYALHASAVAIDGRAYAFTALSGHGKSSLAAGLVRRGYAFLTDDRVLVERTPTDYRVQAGYPQLRLWGDAARHFVNQTHYPVMHHDWRKHLISLLKWGQYRVEPCPLAAVYMVDCQPGYDTVRLTPARGQAGMMQLLRASSIHTVVTDVQIRRLQFMTELLRDLPVKIISYPAAYDRLEETLDTILADSAIPAL